LRRINVMAIIVLEVIKVIGTILAAIIVLGIAFWIYLVRYVKA